MYIVDISYIIYSTIQYTLYLTDNIHYAVYNMGIMYSQIFRMAKHGKPIKLPIDAMILTVYRCVQLWWFNTSQAYDKNSLVVNGLMWICPIQESKSQNVYIEYDWTCMDDYVI